MRLGPLWSLGSGLALGLTGWPGVWGLVGWVWPLLWVRGFKEARPLSLAAFGLGLVSTQALWLVPTLFSFPHFGFGPLALTLGARLCCWWLLFGLWWLWSQRTSRWPALAFFSWGFPFLYLLATGVAEWLPGAPLPVPSPAAREPWVGLLGEALPWWGTLGLDGCLVGAALALVLGLRHKKLLVLALLALGLPWVTVRWAEAPPPSGPLLQVAYLPRSGVLGAHPENGPALADLRSRSVKALALGVDLVVWPQGALPDLGPTDLEALAAVLGPGQGLLLGTERRQEGQGVEQGAYGLLGAERFYFPGAGNPQAWGRDPFLFPVRQFGLAPGLGFEPYLDRWYRPREAQAQGYVHLLSAYGFSPLAQELLAGLGEAKGRQSYKPVLLVANGTLGGPVGPTAKGQDPGTWEPQMIGGLVTLRGVEPVSPFYAFGWALLWPLGLTVALAGLWVSKDPSPSKTAATSVQNTPGSSP